ncbi:SDR family oxidoreductase [Roseomonas gilardii]|uniref:SDR family oxidoreductase n=1 Tax=Roseomonas gilardii TaxID=257708 RepID=A0ABU3MIZ9_9PROT|nr:SDR family oxidoreductase [Roseomonas gilardii]MDT8332887.1 SDR family oxidoreductase [Roseomonas gilardii]
MLMRGKVCVVTGAASPQGIGRATALTLAAHGARVALLDVSANIESAAREVAERHADSAAMGITCNIALRADCVTAAQTVTRDLGRVDAVIHCAGIIRSGGFDQISEKDFEDVLAVNLTGAFNIAWAFAPIMAAQGTGSIVNVASVAAQRGGGLVGGAHYAASKGGVLSLTRSLARELGPSGVRANAVCPSLIETDFVTSAVSGDRIRELTAGLPLGRPGRPDEVAAACMFLASDLSSYITGATLDVNGGSHIH